MPFLKKMAHALIKKIKAIPILNKIPTSILLDLELLLFFHTKGIVTKGVTTVAANKIKAIISRFIY